MDHEVNFLESGRTRSLGRHSGRHSFGLSVSGQHEVDDDIESRSVSEAGDIGDRALHSDRFSGSGRGVVPVPDDIENQLQMENSSPLSANTVLNSRGKTKENDNQLSDQLLSISCLFHLAVLGILGDPIIALYSYELGNFVFVISILVLCTTTWITQVLTRYLLGKLFGPGVVSATSDRSFMYHDLPSNMVGSFLMGWLGAVFKSDISKFSSPLAIGLTTGYLGSLTTFSGWNQKMILLSVQGQWVFAILGFFLGMLLVAASFTFGVDSAKGFKGILEKRNKSLETGVYENWSIDNGRHQKIVLAVLILILFMVWGLSGALLKSNLNKSNVNSAQLWLGCIVGPFSVWTRFYLARLNGIGLAKAGYFKWIPFGTLIANVSAACIMAALATLQKEEMGKTSAIVTSGLETGFCGCLSTVSTFIAEFIAMRESKHPRRAYIYASTTIVISFSLATLIYSLPAWLS